MVYHTYAKKKRYQRDPQVARVAWSNPVFDVGNVTLPKE